MERQTAIYARQSVEKKDSISIETQIGLCRRLSADAEARVYQDRGYSGKNTERPAFRKLLGDIRAGRIGKLYVYRLDRFSRSIADFGQLWGVLTANGVEFVSVTEQFDTSTPMGRAMLHIIMVFAQLERETVAERVRDNYSARAASGAWPGGPAPYGYRNGRLPAAQGRSVSTLTPDETLIPVVRRMFEAYAQQGVSLGDVALMLNRDGVPRAKRAFWDSVSVSRILHNPVYVRADEQVRLHFQALGVRVLSAPPAFDGVHGVLLYGRREANGRRYTDSGEQSAVVLNSEGIVPAALWLACGEKLARNAQVKNSGRGRHTWLSGLLKCASCGYSLKVQTGQRGRRLICSGRYRAACCASRIRIDLTALEDAVAEELDALLRACPEDGSAAQRAAVAALEELDRRAERLLDAFAQSDDLTAAYLRRALAKLEAQRRSVLSAPAREVGRPCARGAPAFSALGFESRKAVAARFVERINVSGDAAEVVWNV